MIHDDDDDNDNWRDSNDINDNNDKYCDITGANNSDIERRI